VHISLVNCRVAGRLRIGVAGLYRSVSVKHRIEQVLTGLQPVRKVRASELTGRVLVLFSADTPAQRMFERIARALDASFPEPVPLPAQSGRPGQAAPGPAPRPTRPTRARERHAPRGQEVSPWHAEATETVLSRLAVDPAAGLSAQEAARRLVRFGPNTLEAAASRSRLAIFLNQFNSLPVAMLGVSAGIAVATGGLVDAGVILGVVAINAVIGYLTEEKAEHTIANLCQPGERHAQVLRLGQSARVRIEELVPGDILLLGPGSQVPADMRLISGRRLTVDESALTGESMPVSKKPKALLMPETQLADRRNMAYMGTLITGGDARAVVVNTAAATELGRIQSLVETTRPPETPMEQQLGRLGTQLGLLSAAACGGVFALGLLRGEPWLRMLTSAMSLAVAAVPEGLPAVATSTLALGIHEMEKRRVAVRKLDAVETLGSLQVLCLDKTGTLTANHMSVVAVHYADRDLTVRDGRFFEGDQEVPEQGLRGLSRLLEIVSLCNEVELDGEGERAGLTGSPTETALVELARSNGMDLDALRRRYPRLLVKERAEGRPWMTTVHRIDPQRHLIAVKGSPKETLKRSNRMLNDGLEVPLDEAAVKRVLAANEHMAANALRVLGVAYRETGDADDRKSKDLTWIGLVGMRDPLRQGMAQLMERYHRAGIATVMITGDQSATAYAIGRELGLNENGSLEILDSAHLDQIDPELLAGLVRRVDVFSRVSPAHKLRIVQAMQRAGRVVAMTGDGINDGPALKAADIGIAMGGAGTDVARSVADVVIEDDNLHTMAEAVRQGRTIYANIRKSVHYLLSTNFSEIEVMFLGIAVGLGQVLNPMQLLWINLVTDVFPALALSLEPPEQDVLRRPPRPADESIITTRKLKRMALESAFITSGALAAHLYGRARGGPALGATLGFHSLTLAQLMHATACRSDHFGLFNPAPELPRNRWLEAALGGTLVLHLLTMLVPGLRRLLGTTSIGALDAAVVVAGAGLPLLINEGIKAARHTRGGGEDRP
jgi:Ca2+-transporting ATPase